MASENGELRATNADSPASFPVPEVGRQTGAAAVTPDCLAAVAVEGNVPADTGVADEAGMTDIGNDHTDTSVNDQAPTVQETEGDV
jgi:hypothetical protein